MAGDPPQPDKIQGYPADAKIKYLFRKTISSSDLYNGLILVRGATEYLNNRGPEMIALFDKGLELKLHTPNNIGLVKLKHYNDRNIFQLFVKGWKEIAIQSGFRAGKIIDCWALSSKEVPLELLIQLAPPKQEPTSSSQQN